MAIPFTYKALINFNICCNEKTSLDLNLKEFSNCKAFCNTSLLVLIKSNKSLSGNSYISGLEVIILNIESRDRKNASFTILVYSGFLSDISYWICLEDIMVFICSRSSGIFILNFKNIF